MDILGTKWCIPIKRRHNILVNIYDRFTEHGDRAYKFCQFAPEGLWADVFQQDFMSIPPVESLADQQFLIWDIDTPPLMNTKIWLFDVTEDIMHMDHLIYTYRYDRKSSWTPLPSPSSQGPIKIAEFFAGGFGGWKEGSSPYVRLSKLLVQEKDINIILEGPIANHSFVAFLPSWWHIDLHGVSLRLNAAKVDMLLQLY